MKNIIISIVMVICSIDSAIAEKTECFVDQKELIKKYDRNLMTYKGFDKAISELDTYFKCKSISANDKGLINYLKGNIYLKEFNKKDDVKYAALSQNSYIESQQYTNKYDLYAKLGLAHLMRDWKKPKNAEVYIDEVLSMNLKNKQSALSAALLISVDLRRWDKARKYVKELNADYQGYYLSPGLLKPLVEVLCYYNNQKSAQNSIKNVEAYMKEHPRYTEDLNSKEHQLFDDAKFIAKDCLR